MLRPTWPHNPAVWTTGQQFSQGRRPLWEESWAYGSRGAMAMDVVYQQAVSEVWHDRLSLSVTAVHWLLHFFGLFNFIILFEKHDWNEIDWGVVIAPWLNLKCRTCYQKVTGLSPSRSRWRIFFSRASSLCSLVFWYPFYLQVTTVACKTYRSFCLKGMLQLNRFLRMWLWMKWRNMVHGYGLRCVHRTCSERAAASCGKSHVTTRECCKCNETCVSY